MSIDVIQQEKKEKRRQAIDLRRKGLSYSEIKKRVNAPKATLSYWLKDIKLSKRQSNRLKKKQIEAIRVGSKKKTEQIKKMNEEIRNQAMVSVKDISKKELWLMGVMLYWRERGLNENDSDSRKGVRFTSSDSHLIKLFLKWLFEVGELRKEEISFDIFLEKSRERKRAKVINYWSEETGFNKEYFPRVYLQKIKRKKPIKDGGRKTSKKTENGLLRVRVKESSMLARQIAGWIEGVKLNLKNNK
ncbi:MAG: hypothetical protein COV29_03220 [Candidatus Yanofskybacteria bacterium CG10_big_fil_rev_8_21_14_0_10_36_16]|uniref:Resolvase HTH domain-containing protein n=1 Tax=Candidatus Yanofskybacteria bacterium CG10_big_fil_rev_8_21_14_0_10_36_16 TaxID=1975096 RepID=A0A2J0Q6Y7_9BACT|nr:MAG: hypothetical protein COV29_03220 [Candidatus Yanofskybacteria bacterium CG10_big_fil_rev_8_21_14_0_10_36_16]